MTKSVALVLAVSGVLSLVAACEREGTGGAASEGAGAGTHTHADGTTHADGDHADDGHGNGDAAHSDGDSHDHEHEEVDLGTHAIGDMQVKFAQSHGHVEPGKEGHLVVKLPYNDSGATIVRAWIGTEDRTLSYVGKGEYAAAHDDYDIHAAAPDPLPEGAMWWIEIEKPDGTKVVGSVKPLTD